MARLDVPMLNMTESVESCQHQLYILNYAWHCALDSGDIDYCDLLNELKELLWNQYKKLGVEAVQPGDIVPWGRKRTLSQLIEGDRQA
ncbi:hypothetical protein [Leptolyngbya sp. FACHB-16]|uniref:hypothetical protein n=1 Tax=unclassified Leptolyngbya TaxID=2650499 RepID=UPI001683246D|nr:hypothetical protein [Leptolyngbya sp. FACHB-16]MBD2153141.1 hypothetical protein [Leptolyngbya sp. FACHB-16]